jgi:SAM-dependent methyltransferase
MAEENLSCGLCHSSALRLIHDQQDSSYFPRRIYRCRACGYAFVHPLPVQEQLDGIYADRAYFDARVSSEETRRVNRGQLERADSRLDWLRRYFTGGKILDMGCGNGEFMLRARERGLDIYGLEVSAAAAAAAGKLTGAIIYTDDPQHLAGSGLRFDLVTLWDVIEHVPDPGRFVRLCVPLLNERGLIAVSTPNQRNYHGVVHGDRWKGYRDGPEHLYFFNKNTLDMLMQHNGLTAIASRTCRISPVLLRWLAPLGYGNELEAVFRLTS